MILFPVKIKITKGRKKLQITTATRITILSSAVGGGGNFSE